MPLLELKTSVPVPEDEREKLLKELSQIVAGAIGKPESYVMVALSQESLCMGGEAGPAAFADIRSIGGLKPSVNQSISKQLCSLLSQRLDIPGDRVYMNFIEISAPNWGWDSSTFG
jgi:phenylpyruvate tautomerase